MIAKATLEPRWTLDSSLQEFMATEFKPYIDERNAPPRKRKMNNPSKWSRFIKRLSEFVKRPAIIGDLTDDTLSKFVQEHGQVNAVKSGRNFKAVAAVAVTHVPNLAAPKHTPGFERGIERHGPCKWTKQETRRLLAAAERAGGSFKRILADGSTMKVSRAAWFAAYVRVARATGLPWASIAKVRNGDITEGGTLVARPPRLSRKVYGPQAYPLGPKTVAALTPLLGESNAKPFAIAAGDDALRVYFRLLCRLAGLESPAGGYLLILSNWKQVKTAGEPIAFEPAPLDDFTLDSPLADFCERYYFPQNLRIKTEATRKNYRTMLKHWNEALGRTVLLRDVTVDNIVRLIRYVESRSVAPHTCEQKQNLAVAIANFCTRRRIINWPVEMTRYETPETHPDSWSLDEMEKLFEACGKMRGKYFGIPAALWWRAIHLVWWDCGERTGATLSVEADWINLETGVVAIPAAARKGRHKAACYELKQRTVAWLRPLVDAARVAGRKEVFAFPGKPATFYNHYGKLLTLAGLPNNRRTKPQKLRRTYGTFIELAGGSATEALGHTSRRTTLESYIDPKIVRKPSPNLLLPDIGVDKLTT